MAIKKIRVGNTTYDVQDANAYVKPSGGIPKTDLASAVQNQLVWEKGSHATHPGAKLNNNCSADGEYAVAEGHYTEASGAFSHAEGNGVAVGVCAHAEGFDAGGGVTAGGDGSHVEGYTQGDGSISASGDGSHAGGSCTGRIYASGSGSFARGCADGNDNAEIYADGAGASATGYACNKGGSGEAVICSSQDGSHAEGYAYTDTSDDSKIISNGIGAHAEGYAKGTIIQAGDSGSHAEGYAYGGDGIEASGYGSHAEGCVNGGDGIVASGKGAHAEGYTDDVFIKAEGDGSHAEGHCTYAEADYAHAEGGYSHAAGAGSHTEGNLTYAEGDYAHAEGNASNAIGESSHAEGYYAATNNFAEHAEGVYNKSNIKTNGSSEQNAAGSTRHSVGIGTSNNARRNAFEIMQNGDAYLFGVGGYDGTNAQAAASSPLQNCIGKMQEITWSALKTLRDGGNLVKGMQYRITDFVTTVNQDNARSAGHAFDVIVVADSNNKLNENARAALHSGDTYFANSKLEAWQLKYCLDNDTTRFAWADTGATGRGVIYYMKDEWNNECPYDFKNIQFKRKISLSNGFPELDLTGGTDTWVFTFAATSYHITNDTWSGLKDGSLESPYGHESDENTSTFHDNVMGKYIKNYDEIDGDNTKCGIQYLNDNVFLGYWEEIGSDDPENVSYYYAYCSYGCTFGVNCYSNTFGHYCDNNTFGNNCTGNTFGPNCTGNTFGDNCTNITFMYGCSGNTFGSNCNSNTFGNGCNYNTFGSDCYRNTFGDRCGGNTFGNDCYRNTFGSDCYRNTFGNGCNFNTFGNGCNFNTFGSNCCSIKFGTASTTKNFYRFIIVENGNGYIYLICSATTSSSQPYKNVKIAQGVNNTTSWKTITDSNVNQAYQTTYQAANSQIINV